MDGGGGEEGSGGCWGRAHSPLGEQKQEKEDVSRAAVLTHPLFQAIKGLDVVCDGWHRGPLTDCRELRCHVAESLQFLYSDLGSQMTGQT